jgi:hypothetical protein
MSLLKGSHLLIALCQVNRKGARAWAHAAGSLTQSSDVAHLLHLLLRYTQALITQMVQTAACNRHHSLDQQLCRWLLLEVESPPMNSETPMTPSFPTTAISADSPFCIT